MLKLTREVTIIGLMSIVILLLCDITIASETSTPPENKETGKQELSIQNIDKAKQDAIERIKKATMTIVTDKGNGDYRGPAGTSFVPNTESLMKRLVKLNLVTEKWAEEFLAKSRSEKFSLLLTNGHIAGKDGIKKIKIFLNGNPQEYVYAELIGTASYTDVSVLKIPMVMPGLPIGDSASLTPGQSLIVVGNPFLLEDTVSHVKVGKIGPLNIDRESFFMEKYQIWSSIPINLIFINIQGAINPGNSGSSADQLIINQEIFEYVPFVVGMCSRGIPGSGFSFFEPMNLMLEDIAQILKTGKTERGWMGITTMQFSNLNDDEIKEFLRIYLNAEWPFKPTGELDGLLILDVDEDSPAYGTKNNTITLLKGDVITHISPSAPTEIEVLSIPEDQWTPIMKPNELISKIRKEIGYHQFKVWRNGERKNIVIKLKNEDEVARRKLPFNSFRILSKADGTPIEIILPEFMRQNQ